MMPCIQSVYIVFHRCDVEVRSQNGDTAEFQTEQLFLNLWKDVRRHACLIIALKVIKISKRSIYINSQFYPGLLT